MKNKFFIEVDIIQKIYNMSSQKNKQNYEKDQFFFRPLNLFWDRSDAFNCYSHVVYHGGMGMDLLWILRYPELEQKKN